MNNESNRAREQVLEAIQSLADHTEKIQGTPGAEYLAFPEIRAAFAQVHKAIYAIHTRLDDIDNR